MADKDTCRSEAHAELAAGTGEAVDSSVAQRDLNTAAAADAVSALQACVEEAGADVAEKTLCREYATEELTLTSDSASTDSVELEPRFNKHTRFTSFVTILN